MNEILVEIKGSGQEPYTIRISREGPDLSAACTCPAGSRGLVCKHRVGLLVGDGWKKLDILGDESSEDVVARVRGLLEGTDAEGIVTAYAQAVAESDHLMKRAKEILMAAKKDLARILSE